MNRHICTQKRTFFFLFSTCMTVLHMCHWKEKKKYAKGERDIEKGALVKVFSHSMPSLFFTLKNGFLNLRFGCDADNRRYINIDFQLFLVSKFYCRFLFTVELWAGIVFGEKRFLKNWFTYVCMCEREMRGLWKWVDCKTNEYRTWYFIPMMFLLCAFVALRRNNATFSKPHLE